MVMVLHMHNTAWVMKYQRLNSPGIQNKTHYYWDLKNTTNNILIYSYISSLFRYHSRSFLLQKTGLITKMYNHMPYRVKDLETLYFKQNVSMNFLLSEFREFPRRRGGKSIRIRDIEHNKKLRSSISALTKFL